MIQLAVSIIPPANQRQHVACMRIEGNQRCLRRRTGQYLGLIFSFCDLHLAGAQSGDLLVNLRNARSEEHTSELQSHSDLVCRLLLEKKKTETIIEKSLLSDTHK